MNLGFDDLGQFRAFIGPGSTVLGLEVYGRAGKGFTARAYLGHARSTLQ